MRTRPQPSTEGGTYQRHSPHTVQRVDYLFTRQQRRHAAQPVPDIHNVHHARSLVPHSSSGKYTNVAFPFASHSRSPFLKGDKGGCCTTGAFPPQNILLAFRGRPRTSFTRSSCRHTRHAHTLRRRPVPARVPRQVRSPPLCNPAPILPPRAPVCPRYSATTRSLWFSIRRSQTTARSPLAARSTPLGTHSLLHCGTRPSGLLRLGPRLALAPDALQPARSAR